MIGSPDTKMAYYNTGLIETLMPLLDEARDLSQQVRTEVFTVFNSFLFDCPKALDTFGLYHTGLMAAVKLTIR